MTKEHILKQQIRDYLRIKNVFFWHNLQGIGSYRGVPDMFALINGTLYAIEVKAPKGKISEWQEKFLNAIEMNGGEVIIARKLEDIMKFI